MFRRSLLQFFSLFLCCFFLVVGCNTAPSGENGDTATGNGEPTTDRITLGTTLKPRTLDPADAYEIAGLNIIANLCDSLYTYKPSTTDLEPHLATEMPAISEDGLTYVIPIREDVVFHDGTALNAEAVKFSLDRFIQNGGKPSFLLADIVDTVEATGDYEVTIALKQPFAAFTALLAFAGTCAVSPEAYALGEGEFTPNEFVGSGPYKLAAFTSDSLRLDVNEDYWGEAPNNEGVDIQIYNDNSANLFNAFQTQAVDIAYQSLDPDQISNLLEGAEEGQWQAIEAPGTAVSFMALNRNQDPLDQPEVRKAVASIVNRDLINERVLKGQADPLYSLIPTSFTAYDPIFEEAYGDGNVEQAKQLLEEAGYTPDNPAVIEVWFPSGSATRSLAAQTLQAFAEQELEGSLQFDPKTVDGATFFQNIKKGIYPATMVFWYPDFLDADNYIQPFLSCAEGSEDEGCTQGGAATQGSFYYDERMNELIEAQRQAADESERLEVFGEIQERLAEDVPYVPLWQNKEYLFVQSGIEGVVMNASQDIPFSLIEK
ncbi:ABC transporter substrate-binding protein [Spirulina sp. CS-785/01]|uniref:ABC transporter substrate-binding protein n=1 Tax=Spirulina sp. CS-785/01 TaxID=3021716 RepID=UPI00232F2814|nr:ABC transporter substrate-binding protein [Spirulina sp. CS-785/01]MDB9314937.1 ABC transporter substrate-binding protein [Spirulina sp. CS-785/01]